MIRPFRKVGSDFLPKSLMCADGLHDLHQEGRRERASFDFVVQDRPFDRHPGFGKSPPKLGIADPFLTHLSFEPSRDRRSASSAFEIHPTHTSLPVTSSYMTTNRLATDRQGGHYVVMSDDAIRDNKKPARRHQRETNFWVTKGAVTLTIPMIGEMSEDQCMQEFAKLRWPQTQGAPICPECGCLKYYNVKARSGARARFMCAGCSKQFSVTSGTPFHSRKLPYKTLMYLILFFVNGAKGEAALEARRQFGPAHKTAFIIFHKLREVIDQARSNVVLTGAAVETDALWIGGHTDFGNTGRNGKGDAKRRKPKQCVLSAVERRGEAVARVVPAETAEQALALSVKHISRDSIVYADEAPAYDVLHARHDTRRINHAIEWARDDVNTNTAEQFNLRMRRAAYGVYHRISGRLLHRYASEMAYRHSRCRTDNGKAFSEVLSLTLAHPPSREWKGSWQKRAA